MTSITTCLTAILGATLLLSCGQSERVQTGDVRTDQPIAMPVTTSSRARRVDDPISRAPRVAAARMRRDAARAAAYAAGVLPDPMLDAQYMRMPDDPMYGSGGMIEIGQTFPRWGERDGMRAMAAAEVAMADADLAMARGEILARLAMSHAQERAAQAKADAYRENAKRANNLAELIAKSAAPTGGARLADVLTLHSRAALGRARSMLGLPASAPVFDPGVPDAAQVDPALNPRVRLAKAAHLQAHAQLMIAASRSRPEVGVRAGWQREGSDAMDEYRVGVSVAIPLRPSAWRGPEEAALRRKDAADLDVAGATVEAEELLARVHRAQDQATRARTLASDTKQRLALELDQVASGAATGEPGSTSMLYERLDMLADTEVMAVMAEADAMMAAAELWMVMPTPDIAAERP
jgi:outer membrane protein TolC